MRKLILILLCISVFSVAQADELTGWEKLVAHKEGERELDKLPTVSLKSRKDNIILVEIKNDTGSELTYSGYGEVSPKLYFKKMEGKSWVPAGWNWCGTGVSHYTLKKDGSVVFKLIMNGKEEIQIFTIFRDANDKRVFSIVKIHEEE